jgi:hypothetical protein
MGMLLKVSVLQSEIASAQGVGLVARMRRSEQNSSVALLMLLGSSASESLISHCRTCEFLKKTVTSVRKHF